MAKRHDPFDVALTDDQKKALGQWMCDELQKGLDARAAQDTEVDYWWALYEQARTRTAPPWPGAADLTSYLANEKTNALHARIMRTVWSDPIWHVEGWGQAAEKAPFVEEFHQWKAEEERLQSVVDKLTLQALVEPRGLLEISEGTELRTSRKRIMAAVETDPTTGGMVVDEKGEPLLQQDDNGQPVEVKDEQTMAAETVVDHRDRIRTGPTYRLLPYRDSVILPGHARDQADIFAYGKRYWRRHSDFQAKAKAGIFDKEAVDRMATPIGPEPNPSLNRAKMDVAPVDPNVGEHEVWEVLILLDLALLFDSLGHGNVKKALQGERWYLTTLHVPSQQLLRVQFDDMERSRFVTVILFPRVDRVTEGYSFVGHQLITVSEEHTSWRNMGADRAHASLNSPIKRLQGALWDPDEQPFGPGAVIDVRDMREVEPMVIPDLSAAALNQMQMIERTAERLAGINDIASGQVAQESRTLGEIQMATEQSFVRMDLIVRRFQESLEDIAQIRHAIWKRVLAEQPNGMDAPVSVVQNLEGRGVSIDQYLPEQKITAQLLEGAFRFRPKGSVESADPNRLRNDMVGFLSVLPKLLQVVPSAIAMFQTPQAARTLVRWFLQTMKIPNPSSILGSPAQDLENTQKAQVMSLMAAMMGQQPGMGAPGMPPGMPGMPGMPPPGMGGPPPMGGPMAGPPGMPPGGPSPMMPPGPGRPQ